MENSMHEADETFADKLQSKTIFSFHSIRTRLVSFHVNEGVRIDRNFGELLTNSTFTHLQ